MFGYGFAGVYLGVVNEGSGDAGNGESGVVIKFGIFNGDVCLDDVLWELAKLD